MNRTFYIWSEATGACNGTSWADAWIGFEQAFGLRQGDVLKWRYQSGTVVTLQVERIDE